MGFATRAEQVASTRWFGDGDRLYQTGRRLGEGGQGQVYHCQRVSDGAFYAAKVVDTLDSGRPSKNCRSHSYLLSNLEQEIKNMRRLQHPSIAQVVDDFREEDECVIIMDLAPLGDLHNHLEKELRMSNALGKVVFAGLGGSEFASKHVARQLLDAVGYMHKQGVIHRDLKLENILVMGSQPAKGALPEFLDVKVSDFGLSKYLGEAEVQPCMKRSKSLIGTLYYMAPEIIHEASYDMMVDYWSLGVMLYMLLCGKLPFNFNSGRRGDSIAEMHAALLTKGISNCMEWHRASADARALVMGLLEVDPELRMDAERCFETAWLWEDPRHEAPLQAAVAALRCRTGCAVDSFGLTLRDGQQESCGGIGGWVQHELHLQPDELILGVVQEDISAHLGASITVFTSNGNVIALQGDWAQPRHVHLAPAGHEIVGLHFEAGELVHPHTAAVAPDGQGSVARVAGRVWDAVDKVEFEMHDGLVRAFGGDGGRQTGHWELEDGELIIAAEQTPWSHCPHFLGSSVAFYTNRGRVLSIDGAAAPRSRRFAVSDGRQVCGLGFEGCSLVSVTTCPVDGDLSAVTVHAVA
mmetsp:Transcript_39980/g.103500  ORF Transcript_39980/g.103500 Transcript_39980/m.103500 type:complete len:580 (+) Transcript_39980:59-1798(+)|eukprot:CAMPEP_0195082988 /NCGR_PEP_ID=MMETSP0448-20130528/24025_1 /TAXON_ID=66468 /ORGANISM="Heterocapsa triquestra, Strain CCMP 448" /LENGTH=579 /DNA_ID=CAMNT_0040116149 /DNA_START=47 /DNA_END=1786 /DNA_ORIENTATION=-